MLARRLTAVVAVLVLTAAACGGGGGRGGATDAAERNDETTTEGPFGKVTVGDADSASEASLTAANRLVAALGADAGAAVVAALDRGYDAEQVIAAAGTDALTSAGEIDGESPNNAATALFTAHVDAVLASHRTQNPNEPITQEDVRTLLAEAADRAEELGRSDDAAGVIALILDLAHAGYDMGQITEALSAPESFSIAEHRTIENVLGIRAPRYCDFIVGPDGETVLPANRPTYGDCRFVFDAVLKARIVYLPATVTSGPVIDAPTVDDVRVNTVTFRYDPTEGTAQIWGDVDREVTLVTGSGDDECRDHKISPLSIYARETEYDSNTGTMSGTFSYRVAAERFQVLGDACEGANTRFGRGKGTWEAAYDPDVGVAGTLTFPGGLGVAEFESSDLDAD